MNRPITVLRTLIQCFLDTRIALGAKMLYIAWNTHRTHRRVPLTFRNGTCEPLPYGVFKCYQHLYKALALLVGGFTLLTVNKYESVDSIIPSRGWTSKGI